MSYNELLFYPPPHYALCVLNFKRMIFLVKNEFLISDENYMFVPATLKKIFSRYSFPRKKMRLDYLKYKMQKQTNSHFLF